MKLKERHYQIIIGILILVIIFRSVNRAVGKRMKRNAALKNAALKNMGEKVIINTGVAPPVKGQWEGDPPNEDWEGESNNNWEE